MNLKIILITSLFFIGCVTKEDSQNSKINTNNNSISGSKNICLEIDRDYTFSNKLIKQLIKLDSMISTDGLSYHFKYLNGITIQNRIDGKNTSQTRYNFRSNKISGSIDSLYTFDAFLKNAYFTDSSFIYSNGEEKVLESWYYIYRDNYFIKKSGIHEDYDSTVFNDSSIFVYSKRLDIGLVLKRKCSTKNNQCSCVDANNNLISITYTSNNKPDSVIDYEKNNKTIYYWNKDTN